MTVAISEILKQVEVLPLAEQLELAAKLSEQMRQNIEALPHNGSPAQAVEAASPALPDAEDDDDWLDGFRFNPVPPIDSYVIQVKFIDGGRGQPRRYDFGDLFDDEEEATEGVG